MSHKIDLNPQEVLECLTEDLIAGKRDPEAARIIAEFYVKAVKENVINVIRERCPNDNPWVVGNSPCIHCAVIIAEIEKPDLINEM